MCLFLIPHLDAYSLLHCPPVYISKMATRQKRKVPTQPVPKVVRHKENGELRASSFSQSSEESPNKSTLDEDQEFSDEDNSPDDPEIDDPSSEDEERSLIEIVDEDFEKSEREPLPLPVDRESKGLVPSPSIGGASDPLQRYLKEMQLHPLLTPEEELELALKLHKTGDLDAAKRLVSANLRLVVKIAFEYRSVYANVMDLIQEGNIGLMKAVSKFDPTKGARLSYYSSWWIRSYILKYLLDNFRLVRVGTTQAQKKLFYHLMKEKDRLEAQGLIAGPKLLAERLNVREKDVEEMQQRLSGHGAEVRLDAPLNDEEKSPSHSEFLKDSAELADSVLERSQLLEILERRLPEFQKTLNVREKQLLQERILSESPKTLQEVADDYGLTRERARQIEARLIEKLRNFLSLGD